MKYFLLISLLFLSSIFGDTLPLNVAETISRSLKESEDYKIQKNEVIKSENKTKETASILFPQITGELTYIGNVHYPELIQTKMLKGYNFDAGINVNQIITTFGKISATIDAMKKFTFMNKYHRDSVKDDVIFNSKLLYYNALFAKKVLQITQESYENTLKNKNILENHFGSGRTSKKDNLKISADVAARIPMIANAEATYSNALMSLKKSMGVSPEMTIDLIEGYRISYSNFNTKQAFTNLDEKQPALKALELSIEAQEDLLKSKKREYFPTLSVFFRHNYKGSSDEYFIGNDVLYNYTVMGLNLQVPLFYGDRTNAKIKQSIADKDNAILTYQKTKKNLELELEKAITEYKELTQSLPANEDAVRLSQEFFNMSQNLYGAGQVSVTDLDDAEMMLTNQKIKKETNLFKLQIAIAKMERLSCIEAKNE